MIARTDKHNHFPTGYYIFLFLIYSFGPFYSTPCRSMQVPTGSHWPTMRLLPQPFRRSHAQRMRR